jgi:hypothetical protein
MTSSASDRGRERIRRSATAALHSGWLDDLENWVVDLTPALSSAFDETAAV